MACLIATKSTVFLTVVQAASIAGSTICASFAPSGSNWLLW